MPRKTTGRQKIEIKKITDESNLLVTFSKRHSGLFKKASELSTLCGLEMALIVFSPTKKVYSFGHPSVQHILDRFLHQNPPSPFTSQLVQHYRNAKIQELNVKLTILLGQLEAEKKISQELNKLRNARKKVCWWDAPLDYLGVEALEILKVATLEMKKSSERQVERLKEEKWLTLHQ